jgi:hypothetical protein
MNNESMWFDSAPPANHNRAMRRQCPDWAVVLLLFVLVVIAGTVGS